MTLRALARLLGRYLEPRRPDTVATVPTNADLEIALDNQFLEPTVLLLDGPKMLGQVARAARFGTRAGELLNEALDSMQRLCVVKRLLEHLRIGQQIRRRFNAGGEDFFAQSSGIQFE